MYALSDSTDGEELTQGRKGRGYGIAQPVKFDAYWYKTREPKCFEYIVRNKG